MNWMEIALKEAKKSYNIDEVPVGCVLIKDGKLVSKAHNKKEYKHNVLGHAEIRCIKKAAKRLKTWKLNGTILYVTLEPCDLCDKVIRESRIDSVVYLTKRLSYKKQYNKTQAHKENNEIAEEKYKVLLKQFFDKKRKGTKWITKFFTENIGLIHLRA